MKVPSSFEVLRKLSKSKFSRTSVLSSWLKSRLKFGSCGPKPKSLDCRLGSCICCWLLCIPAFGGGCWFGGGPPWPGPLPAELLNGPGCPGVIGVEGVGVAGGFSSLFGALAVEFFFAGRYLSVSRVLGRCEPGSLPFSRHHLVCCSSCSLD